MRRGLRWEQLLLIACGRCSGADFCVCLRDFLRRQFRMSCVQDGGEWKQRCVGGGGSSFEGKSVTGKFLRTILHLQNQAALSHKDLDLAEISLGPHPNSVPANCFQYLGMHIVYPRHRLRCQCAWQERSCSCVKDEFQCSPLMNGRGCACRRTCMSIEGLSGGYQYVLVQHQTCVISARGERGHCQVRPPCG